MSGYIEDRKKRGSIFAAIMVSCIGGSMLSTALNTALPGIIGEFGISVTQGQWITSGFSLTMAIMIPLTAFLIKRFSTRRLFLTSMAINMAGIVICMLSRSFPVMMAGRVLQAISSGMTTSLAQVMILTIFPPDKRGSAMGWYGLSLSAAPIVAPAIAGIIIDAAGWRMVFALSLAIVAGAFIYSLFVMDNVLETSRPNFDILSFILSAMAFGGITLGIGNVARQGLSPMVITALALGVVGSVAFVLRQLRLQSPLLDIRILRFPRYALCVLSSMLLYLVMMASAVMIPIYVQSIRGVSATISGLVVMPGALATTLLSPFAGKFYDRFGIRPLLLFSSVCLIASDLLTSLVGLEASIWLVAVYNVLRNMAIGSIMMPIVTWGVTSLPKEKTSDGSALLNSLRTISGAIGAAVFVAVMNGYGFNRAFLCMAIAGIPLLVIAICVKLLKI